MKVIFLSNFFDHHVKPISEAFNSFPDVEYLFVATTKMTEERIRLGYDNHDSQDYVKEIDMEVESDVLSIIEMINKADVVILGAAPFKLVRKRLWRNKLTFLYSERIFKEGIHFIRYCRILIGNLRHFAIHRNLYFLSASAFAPYDYMIAGGCFKGKSLKFGYFTEFKEYSDINSIVNNKRPRSLLWVGRFIDWKHPEIPVKIAKRLFDSGVDFSFDMIGTGPMFDDIRKMVLNYGLDAYFTIHDSMSPTEVRRYMEESEILLFTSDKNEGWGAVLNEAFNSACAVIANERIGSVPYMMTHGYNGLIYEDGNESQLFDELVSILNDSNLRKEVSKNAYNTIKNVWNANNAVNNFMKVVGCCINKSDIDIIHNGPCSMASIIKG